MRTVSVYAEELPRNTIKMDVRFALSVYPLAPYLLLEILSGGFINR